jgi:hypothetical protein
MLNMKLYGLAGVSAVSALILATVPANAQPMTSSSSWANRTLAQRENALVSRADHDWDDGFMDRTQFLRVTNAIANVRRDEDRLRDEQAGELTGGQMASLQDRLDGVAGQINWMDDEQ